MVALTAESAGGVVDNGTKVSGRCIRAECISAILARLRAACLNENVKLEEAEYSDSCSD